MFPINSMITRMRSSNAFLGSQKILFETFRVGSRRTRPRSRSKFGSSFFGPYRRTRFVVGVGIMLGLAATPAWARTRAIVVSYAESLELESELDTLEEDYLDGGSDVIRIVVPARQPFSSWTAHEWVRTQLRQVDELEGAILIGSVPTAFVASGGREIPSDLVYRLLDANFVDEDNDGVYDRVEGDLRASVPVGRVTMPETNLMGPGPLEATRRYLNRVHAHRSGDLPVLPSRGVHFIDSPFGRGDNRPEIGEMEEVYGPEGVTTVVDPDYGFEFDETTMARYRAIVEDPQGHEMVRASIHSSPARQSFYRTDANARPRRMASVNSSDYRLWDTRVSFFVFESCSSCTFSQ